MQVTGPDLDDPINQEKLDLARQWLERRGFFVLPDFEWAPEVCWDRTLS